MIDGDAKSVLVAGYPGKIGVAAKATGAEGKPRNRSHNGSRNLTCRDELAQAGLDENAVVRRDGVRIERGEGEKSHRLTQLSHAAAGHYCAGAVGLDKRFLVPRKPRRTPRRPLSRPPPYPDGAAGMRPRPLAAFIEFSLLEHCKIKIF